MDVDVNEMLDLFDMYPERKSDIIRMYSRRFGQSIVSIQTPSDGMPNGTNLRESDSGDEIHIRGQKMWSHYFNAIGSNVTRLKIDYDALCRKLHKLIGQTCAVNLIGIKFVGIWSMVYILKFKK